MRCPSPTSSTGSRLPRRKPFQPSRLMEREAQRLSNLAVEIRAGRYRKVCDLRLHLERIAATLTTITDREWGT